MKTTKKDFDAILFADNRKLLDVIPDEARDVLDHFVMQFLHRLSMNNIGCGFYAIQAAAKLEILRSMQWYQLRQLAEKSPDFPEFERTFEEGAHV